MPSRAHPPTDDVCAGLVREIARCYAEGDEQRLPHRLLLTAAAAQFQAMYHGQVRPALDRGALVLTDGWWNKTWSRLVVEKQPAAVAVVKNWTSRTRSAPTASTKSAEPAGSARRHPPAR